MTKDEWKALSKEEKGELVSARIAAGDGSAGQIAKSLGVSRNVIIGVASRNNIDLPGDRTLHRQAIRKLRSKAKGPAKPKPKPKAVAAPTKPKPLPAVVGGKPFIDLQPGECKWPLWKELSSPASQSPHCGAAAVEGSPWCAHHKAKSEPRIAA